MSDTTTEAIHRSSLRFYDMARAGHVKRWHIINTAHDQTVAEHSFMVMLISMELAQHLVPAGETVFDDLREEYRFVCHALTHDLPEIKTGDFPAPSKRMIQAFTGQHDLFERIDRAIMPEIPWAGGTLNVKLGSIIDVADAIEAAHWIRENGLGRHAEIVTDSTFERIEQKVHAYSKAIPDWRWYEAANHVLMEMGMPYIYQSAEITPP